MMFGEQFEIDARLVIVALEKAFRDQRDEIAIADEVGSEQRDVRLVARRAIEASARRHVGFATENRRKPQLARRVVELHRAVHDAVIGQGNRGRADFSRAPAEPGSNVAGSIRQAPSSKEYSEWTWRWTN